MTKVCCHCRLEKDVNEFHKCSTTDDGYRWECKSCRSNINKKSYQKHKSIIDNRVRIRVIKNRIMVNALKKRPCADCGIEYPPYVMEFDHIKSNKKFNIGEHVQYSFTRLFEEISKCEVVCANCHKIRTHQRKSKKYELAM